MKAKVLTRWFFGTVTWMLGCDFPNVFQPTNSDVIIFGEDFIMGG